VIDDDPAVAQRLEEPLSRHNVKVEKANGLETALYKFNTIRFDVVVVEIVQFASGISICTKMAPT